MFRRCLGIDETKLGPEDDEVTHTRLSVGIFLKKAGRLEEAEELLRRCLKIFEAKLSPVNVHWKILTVDALHHLGVLVRETGRLREVKSLIRRCLAIHASDG